jgi:hypothetical protein
VFLKTSDYLFCLDALARLLGPVRLQYLLLRRGVAPARPTTSSCSGQAKNEPRAELPTHRIFLSNSLLFTFFLLSAARHQAHRSERQLPQSRGSH